MKQQGIGFFGILGLIFITLKILAIDPVAGWSWWLVLMPLYGGLVLAMIIVAVILLATAICDSSDRRRRNARRG